MTLKGTVQGGVVILEPGASLAEGTEVRIEPIDQKAQPTVTDESIKKRTTPRRAGSAEGLITISPDFDEPLPEFEEYMR